MPFCLSAHSLQRQASHFADSQKKQTHNTALVHAAVAFVGSTTIVFPRPPPTRLPPSPFAGTVALYQVTGI